MEIQSTIEEVSVETEVENKRVLLLYMRNSFENIIISNIMIKQIILK